MKFSDLDQVIARNFLTHTRAFMMACHILSEFMNEQEPETEKTTPEEIAQPIAQKANEIVRSLSDDEIRQELQQLDIALQVSFDLGHPALFKIVATDESENIVWGKEDEST